MIYKEERLLEQETNVYRDKLKAIFEECLQLSEDQFGPKLNLIIGKAVLECPPRDLFSKFADAVRELTQPFCGDPNMRKKLAIHEAVVYATAVKYYFPVLQDFKLNKESEVHNLLVLFRSENFNPNYFRTYKKLVEGLSDKFSLSVQNAIMKNITKLCKAWLIAEDNRTQIERINIEIGGIEKN